ncbi:Autophagy protein 5 [Aphelenchoides fujianensis]|nr:Autophagy protein 5 [Aphelenchoides fujianensis]
MSAKSTADRKKHLLKLTECSICYSQLLDPRLLRCGHSFCFACISTLCEQSRQTGARTIECAECRMQHPVDGELPLDFRLKQMVEAMDGLLNEEKNEETPDLAAEVPETAVCSRCAAERGSDEFFVCETCSKEDPGALICSLCVVKGHRQHTIKSVLQAEITHAVDLTAANKDTIEKVKTNSVFFFDRYNTQREHVIFILDSLDKFCDQMRASIDGNFQRAHVQLAANLHDYDMCNEMLANFQRRFELTADSMELLKESITKQQPIDIQALLHQNGVSGEKEAGGGGKAAPLTHLHDPRVTPSPNHRGSLPTAAVSPSVPQERSVEPPLPLVSPTIGGTKERGRRGYGSTLLTHRRGGRRREWRTTTKSADGQPLKWHHPVGVLFDLHSSADELPWTVVVRLKNFPPELIRGTREAMKNCFLQTIKEADQLKHKGQVISDMKADEHLKLFDSICTGKFDDFWSLDKPFRQGLIKTTKEAADGADEAEVVFEDAVRTLLPDDAERRAARFVSHGVELPLETPVLWMARNLAYPDNFVHVVIKRNDRRQSS